MCYSLGSAESINKNNELGKFDLFGFCFLFKYIFPIKQMLGNIRLFSVFGGYRKTNRQNSHLFFIFCLSDRIEQLTERVIHGLWAPYLHVGVCK